VTVLADISDALPLIALNTLVLLGGCGVIVSVVAIARRVRRPRRLVK